MGNIKEKHGRAAYIERKRRIYAAVLAELGDAVLCDRCGATFESCDGACTASLDERCPGFDRIDAAYKRAEKANPMETSDER